MIDVTSLRRYRSCIAWIIAPALHCQHDNLIPSFIFNSRNILRISKGLPFFANFTDFTIFISLPSFYFSRIHLNSFPFEVISWSQSKSRFFTKNRRFGLREVKYPAAEKLSQYHHKTIYKFFRCLSVVIVGNCFTVCWVGYKNCNKSTWQR